MKTKAQLRDKVNFLSGSQSTANAKLLSPQNASYNQIEADNMEINGQIQRLTLSQQNPDSSLRNSFSPQKQVYDQSFSQNVLIPDKQGGSRAQSPEILQAKSPERVSAALSIQSHLDYNDKGVILQINLKKFLNDQQQQQSENTKYQQMNRSVNPETTIRSQVVQNQAKTSSIANHEPQYQKKNGETLNTSDIQTLHQRSKSGHINPNCHLKQNGQLKNSLEFQSNKLNHNAENGNFTARKSVDFQVAYQQLSKKISKEIREQIQHDPQLHKVQQLLIAQNDLQEESLQPEIDEDSIGKQQIHNRLYQDHKQKLDRLRVIGDQAKQVRELRELAECTFRPQVRVNQELRVPSDFYRDQMMFKQAKESKLELQRKLKEEKEMEECNKSTIRQRSISISKSPRQTAVCMPNNSGMESSLNSQYLKCPVQITHERLYKQNIGNPKPRNSEISQQQALYECSNTVQGYKSPRLKPEEISSKLYEDAQIRRLNNILRNQQEELNLKRQQVKASEKANEVCAGRLLKSIERAFQNYECMDKLELNQQMVQELLAYLGYIGVELHNKENIVKDVWSVLTISKTNQAVTKRSFIVFLNALNNIYLPWMSEQVSDHDLAIYNAEEVKTLHKRFFPLWEYHQKASKLVKPSSWNTSSGDLDNSISKDQWEFRPIINPKSKNLAQRQLSRLKQELQQMNLDYKNHEDYLLKKGLAIKETHNQMVEVKAQLELVECTFKPQTIARAKSREKSVFEELYEKKNIKSRSPLDRSIMDFEKEKQECTFKPNLDLSVYRSNKYLQSTRKHPETQATTPIKQGKSIGKINQSYASLKMKQLPHKTINISRQGSQNNLRTRQMSQTPIVIPEVKKSHNLSNRQTVIKKEYQTNVSDLGKKNNIKQKGAFMIPVHKPNGQLPEDDPLPMPILFLDVNLKQGRCGRLIINEGDDPQEIAKQFANEHKLDESKYQKLLKAIYHQLSFRQ